MSDDNGEDVFRIEASVDDIDLSVEAPDEEWVERKFTESLDLLQEVSEEDDEVYHVEAGAGWLMAHAHGDSPEEAKESWEEIWDRMLDDVEDLSDGEREQAGIARQ